MKSKLNSITQAHGVFSNCGPGVDAYELSYNCKGPGCTAISGFQNVICNSDSHGMTCSNNVKCPDGTSSLQSNFTFGQNELDPWSPNWANQQDVLVPQEQDISISNCAHFSLTSDGTSDGTQIDVGDLTGDKTCPRPQSRPQKSPIAMAEEGAQVPEANSGGGTDAIVTVRPKLQQSSEGTRMTISISTVFSVAIVALLLFSPGVHAASSNLRQEENRERAEVRIREVSDKVKDFANDFSDSLANIANAAGQGGEDYANNLVAGVVISICDGYYQGDAPSQFSPTVVQNCVKSVYGEENAALPASQFLAVFGASLLCNYVVGEAYTMAQEFVLSGCEELQELAYKRTKTLSAPASIQTTKTIPTAAKFTAEDVSKKSTMDTGQTTELSSTAMTSRTVSSGSQSDLESSAFKSLSTFRAAPPSTPSTLLDPLSETASISQGFREQSHSTDMSSKSIVPPLQATGAVAAPNSRSASSNLVSQSLRLSRSVSSPLVFAQTARSSDKKSSSTGPLTSSPGTSVDIRLLSQALISTAQPSNIATFLALSSTTFVPTTSDITPVSRSSTSTEIEQSQLLSLSSKPTHLDTDTPTLSMSRTSMSIASPMLSRNTSTQVVPSNPLQYITSPTLDPDTFELTSTASPKLSNIPSPSLPPLLNSNNTNESTSNWTFSNTASYAIFDHAHPSVNAMLLLSSSSTPNIANPSSMLPSPPSSASSHGRSNNTRSTSTMAAGQVTTPVQTVRVTTVVVVVESGPTSSADSAATRRSSTGTSLTRSAAKTRYEGAGGFIAKGFNGLW